MTFPMQLLCFIAEIATFHYVDSKGKEGAKKSWSSSYTDLLRDEIAQSLTKLFPRN